MDAVNRYWSDCLGKLLLRFTVGGLMLCHGIAKVMHGIDMISGAVKAHNWPEFIAYGVYVGEVFAPLLIIVGFWTRFAAAIMAINMVVAVTLVHTNDLATLNQGGGWTLELQGFYFFGALCIMFLGAGRYSIDALLQRRGTELPPTDTK